MNSKERSDHDASKVAKFLITDPIEIDEKVNEPIRDLLGKYSSIRAEKMVEHVVALVRDPHAVASVVILFASLVISVAARFRYLFPKVVTDKTYRETVPFKSSLTLASASSVS
jgi:hypothetical protein